MARFGRKRLSVDLPKQLHESLTIISKKRNITLTRYILQALIRYSLNETKYSENIHEFCKFTDKI